MPPLHSIPNQENLEAFLLSCRYGDTEEVEAFLQKFDQEGSLEWSKIVDENQSNALHMAAANGHDDILTILLPRIPASLISAPNKSGNTPLHWASLNSHFSTIKLLVAHVPPDSTGPTQGLGVDLIDVKNAAGHTPLGIAEENGWEDGGRWMIEVMNIKSGDQSQPEEGDEEIGDADFNGVDDIEVEIEDADGGVARLKLRDSDGRATDAVTLPSGTTSQKV